MTIHIESPSYRLFELVTGPIIVDKISVNLVRTKETSTLAPDILPQNSTEMGILKIETFLKNDIINNEKICYSSKSNEYEYHCF